MHTNENTTGTYSDSGVSVRLRDTNVGISLDIGRLSATQRLEVLDAVVHILDSETEDLNPHSADVRCRDLAHQLRKLVAVLVDRLHAQCT